MYHIYPKWVKRTAEAICNRNGVRLHDSLIEAEKGNSSYLNSDSQDAIESFVHALKQDILKEISSYKGIPFNRHQSRRESYGTGHSDHNTKNSDRDREEMLEFVETVVRVAATGSICRFVADNSNFTNSSRNDIESDEADEGLDDEALAKRRISNLMVRGLLFAFESFQRGHSTDREHYPRSQGGTTVGSCGWDTLLLLYFVHRIPQVALLASPSVVEEVTGQMVREWRKLLVRLQSLDPNEAPEFSRRRGALAVVNGLLATLFQHHNTHQCRILLNTVAHSEEIAEKSGDMGKSIIRPAQHMVAEVVTFNYYKGRMLLYERQLFEAHDALQKAYTLLPPPGYGTDTQHRNKQRVRFFLAVAGIASGRHIPGEILATDEMLNLLFGPLVKAIERGDPVAYTLALEVHGGILRRRGVYLLLQQSKLLCFSNLLARVYAALGKINGVDSTRIPISALIAAYNFIIGEGRKLRESEENPTKLSEKKKSRIDEDCEGTMTDDAMTLWVAKLISRGHARGYISHEHKTIVLSRKDPFPLLKDWECLSTC